MNFKASLDKLSKTFTIVCPIAFLLFAVFSSTFSDEGFVFKWKGLLIALVVLVITYLFSVRSYTIKYDSIYIHRIIKDVIIHRNEIVSLELLDSNQLKFSVRTFGNGGLFGYYGKYFNSNIGKMTWYATKRSNAICIRTNSNKNIIITPDDPKAFLEYYNNL